MARLFRFILVLSGAFLFSCTGQNKTEVLKIGFGKADLTRACFFDDPVSDQKNHISGDTYRREEKFAISDRVEGRWRPGSGGTRKLVDSLFVAAMYGEDQNGPWTLISLDMVSLDYHEIDLLAEALFRELGIPKSKIILLPSHSHATPPLDEEKFLAAVLEAVSKAKSACKQVEIATLDLQLEGKKYLINRRIHVEGIGSRTVMFNDGCQIHDDYLDATEHIHDWVENLGVNPDTFFKKDQVYLTDGDVDPKLQALFIRDRKTGEMMGSFTRFAAHAVIVSAKVVDGDVSADFPGYLKHRLEEKLGGIAMFGQGPSGDLRPLNKEYSHDLARDYGWQLADKLIGEFGDMEWEALSRLEFYSEPVDLPLIDNIFLTSEEVEAEMLSLEKNFDQVSNPEERRKLQNKFWGLYRTPWVHQMVRPEWKQEGKLGLNLYALRFNDQVLLATQGEIFSEIGRKMVEPYEAYHPILVSLANEYISYLPGDEEREKGGYESSVSIVTPGSPDLLVQASYRLLDRIYDSKVQNPDTMKIEIANCDLSKLDTTLQGMIRVNVLPDEISGIETNVTRLTKESSYTYQPAETSQRVLLMIDGSGSVSQGAMNLQLNELDLFIPQMQGEFVMEGSENGLSYLEISMSLTPEDLDYLKGREGLFPYHVTYEDCKTYTEAIKSSKTVSRMILPEEVIPRLCIGSVSSTGPDEVSAHAHPMLEQLFFGLKENDVLISADGLQSRFLENDLLHVPLGSDHGVQVETGSTMHYIWIDLFHNLSDMDYMKENHQMQDE